MKLNEIDLDKSIPFIHAGIEIEIVGAILKEGEVAYFKAKKNGSSFQIENNESKDLSHKLIAAKIMHDYSEYFV